LRRARQLQLLVRQRRSLPTIPYQTRPIVQVLGNATANKTAIESEQLFNIER
jgi:hypothetical protein